VVVRKSVSEGGEVTAIPTATDIWIFLISISGGLRQMRDLSLRVGETISTTFRSFTLAFSV
jgi:hypothetical protein